MKAIISIETQGDHTAVSLDWEGKPANKIEAQDAQIISAGISIAFNTIAKIYSKTDVLEGTGDGYSVQREKLRQQRGFTAEDGVI